MNGIVIDECVFMEAVRYKKPDGSHAIAEAGFMCRMLRFPPPHAVFVNGAIVDKFRDIEKKINAIGHPGDYNSMTCKNFLAALSDSKRTSCVDGIKIDWEGLKKCDRELVGVALQSGGTLVTSDKPLRGIVERMRSQCARIDCVAADQAIQEI